jgi:trimeric autotransporter adhesin
MRLPIALLLAAGTSVWAQPMTPTAFIQSIGINTHLAYQGTPYYANPQGVFSALQYLGINTVRDQSPLYNTIDPTSRANAESLASYGVKFDVLMLGNGAVNVTGNLASITSFVQAHSGSVSSIELPNEINAWPISYGNVTNSVSAGVAVTKALSSAVKASSTLRSIPIYALTLSDGFSNATTYERQFGNLSSYVSYGNAHIYGGNINAWSGAMQYWLPIFKESTPGKPTVITETGYSTMANIIDETSAAKYNLNLLFENALNGVSATYLFELVDLDSSASDTDYDVHFGQFHSDWSPKIGATALHSLNTILKNAGSGSTASTLNYKITGLPSAGHSFLLGSSSNFDLAVWIDATVFDSPSNSAITASTYAATVSLGKTFSSVAVYDPMIGTSPIATYTNASSVKINVVDHPLIVQAH